MQESFPEPPQEFIPLDKSRVIRHAALDRIRGEELTAPIFEEFILSDDLRFTGGIYENWFTDEQAETGESATNYRVWSVTALKQRIDKEFILSGTLRNRPLSNPKDVIKLPQYESLLLDNRTSQWATALALNGDRARLANAPYKLKVTYDIIDEREAKGATMDSIAQRDATIAKQAGAFIALMNHEQPDFEVEQAEDFCFANVFGYITDAAAEQRFKSLKGHESDRFTEMEKVRSAVAMDREIDSLDHRAVQAGVMAARYIGKKAKVKFPDAVNKSWPEFWKFIEWSDKNL